MTSAEASTPEAIPTTADEDVLFEIVEDHRLELPPLGAYGTRIASLLNTRIELIASERGLGRAVTEMLFRIRSNPNLQRRPDVAFVSFEKWPRGRRLPSSNAWDVVPELVVEVVSPTNLAEEIPTRIREYFEAGVRLAWVIYPHESLVYEYDSPWSIRVLRPQDALEGGATIPGFQIPLADLFEGTDEVEPS